ncbi:MAG: hypothetical protein N2749_06445 [Clostridia bacterium]|nr:hypothetical protein [Clostridia bacterium]
MKKNINKILALVIIVISLSLIYVVYTLVLKSDGKLNQGYFRINDFVTKSTVLVEEAGNNSTDNNTTNLSDLVLNISQNNELNILVAQTGEIGIQDIYIDKLKLKEPSKKGEFTIFSNDATKVYNIVNSKEIYELSSAKQEDGQYLIKININNSNILKNVSIPEGVNSVTYDGTILKNFGINTSDIKFSIEFYLNIKDQAGRLNKCKINLNIPTDILTTSGISVNREDLSNFAFAVK